MKKRHFNFKHLFTVSFLAVAGLFGVSASITNREVNISPLIERADALGEHCDPGSVSWKKEKLYGRWYRVIYVYIYSGWGEDKAFGYGDYNWRYKYTTDASGSLDGSSGTTIEIGKKNDESISEIIGDYAVKLYLPTNVKKIQIRRENSDSSAAKTATQVLSDLADDKNEFFVVTTSNGSSVQTGQWLDEANLGNYIFPNYFTVETSWHGGQSHLENFFIYCDNTDGANRATPIPTSAIHKWPNGISYAKMYVPSTANSDVQMLTESGAVNPAKKSTIQSTLAADKLYSVVAPLSTGASRQPITYGAFPTSTDYYLVGLGSFQDGNPWEKEGGVRMDTSSGNFTQLSRQYLVEGDIVKGRKQNDSDPLHDSWIGWASDICSAEDKNNLSQGVFYNIMYTTNGWQDGLFRVNKSTYEEANIYGPASEGIDVYLKCEEESIYTASAYLCLKTGNGKWYWPTYIEGERNKSQLLKYNVSESDIWNGFYFIRVNPEGYGDDDNRIWNTSFSACGPEYVGTDFNFLNYNVYVKTTGYFDIYVNNSSKFWFSKSNDHTHKELYLDLGIKASEWPDYGAIVARFYVDDQNTEAISVRMTKVHGSTNSNLYEAVIPILSTGIPNKVVFFGADTFKCDEYNPHSGGTMFWTWYASTYELDIDSTKNVFKLTASDDYVEGEWNSYISTADRCNYYGTYLLSEATCSGMGSVTATSENWNNVWS